MGAERAVGPAQGGEPAFSGGIVGEHLDGLDKGDAFTEPFPGCFLLAFLIHCALISDTEICR